MGVCYKVVEKKCACIKSGKYMFCVTFYEIIRKIIRNSYFMIKYFDQHLEDCHCKTDVENCTGS